MTNASHGEECTHTRMFFDNIAILEVEVVRLA
jgi:hypothetical protein